MVESLRRRAGELLGESSSPPVLWVTNTPLTDAMAIPQPGPPLDLGYHFDWLLAAGEHQLGLIRIPGARLTKCDLVLASPYEGLHVDVADHGLLDRRRTIVITLPDGRWFALGCRLTGRKVGDIDAFTEAVRRRCGAQRAAH